MLLLRVHDRRAYREIAAWWLLTRAVVFGAALAVGAIGWPAHPTHHGLGLLTGWDGNWYRRIATDGYHTTASGKSDLAFFPLLPVLMANARRLGIPTIVSGLVAANACFLAGLCALHALHRRWVDEETARRSAIYAAVFPMSFVFSMAYPESLALAAIAIAAWAALRSRWDASTALTAAATMARPQSVLVAIPIAATAWAGGRRGRPAALVAAVAAPVAIAAFSLYLWRTVGDASAWTHAEKAWGRSFSLRGPIDALRQVVHAPYSTLGDKPYAVVWLLRDVTFVAVYLGLLAVAAARTRIPRPWLAYGLLVVVLPLFTGSFTSAARFGLLALPAFAGLAVLGRSRSADLAIKALGIALLVVFVGSLAYRYP